MTIQEAIERTDALKPNQYTPDQKIMWLSILDGQIWHEVILTHEGAPQGEDFSGYDGDTAHNTELLVAAPYDADIYINFLQARIDRENAETAKYNQSITMFNNAYSAWLNWYNRHHRPLLRHNFFRF